MSIDLMKMSQANTYIKCYTCLRIQQYLTDPNVNRNRWFRIIDFFLLLTVTEVQKNDAHLNNGDANIGIDKNEEE